MYNVFIKLIFVVNSKSLIDLLKILTALKHIFYNDFSCETQLLVTMYGLVKYKDSKHNPVITILLFSKACDVTVVPRDLILYIKLACNGHSVY